MYELIEHKMLSANAASVTFSNIPQFYTDLLLVGSARTSRSSGAFEDSVTIRPNGETSGITQKVFFGNGSSAASTDYVVDGALRFVGASSHSTANTFGSAYAYFPGYSSSQTKTISIDSISENNAAEGWQFTASTRWNSTAAITSITLDPLVGAEILPFSSFTLYGINRTANLGRANYAPKATGGSIIYSNGFWYHVFRSSGSFVPQSSFNAEYLLVAGGGGGGGTSGNCAGAGGGGGGINAYSLAVTPQSYTVTVGAGGGSDSSGSSSSFGAQSLTGGGGGASGGGGGGVGGLNAGSGAGGNCGGNGSNGGNGPSTFTSWAFPSMTGQTSGTLAYYSGGGGSGSALGNGSSGGLGGGGGGGNGNPGTPGNGEANTGGGGGGRGTANFGNGGGSGGSGVVIVRYPAA